MKTLLKAVFWLRVFFFPAYSEDVRSTDFYKKGGAHRQKSTFQIRELDGRTQVLIPLWFSAWGAKLP